MNDDNSYSTHNYSGYNAQATQNNEGWHNQSSMDRSRMNVQGGQTWGYTTPPQGGQMMMGAEMGPMIVANWPSQQRDSVSTLVSRYGPPDEVTPSVAVWKNRGSFDCVKVFREEVQHSWPVAHSDFIEHAIAYKVPVDKVGDLAKFDGSLIVDRTKGCLAAKCDS
jgi:hypothetical protein